MKTQKNTNIFTIQGYFKDTKEVITDRLIYAFDAEEDVIKYGIDPHVIFQFGMGEHDIQDAIKREEDTIHDFVITKYEYTDTILPHPEIEVVHFSSSTISKEDKELFTKENVNIVTETPHNTNNDLNILGIYSTNQLNLTNILNLSKNFNIEFEQNTLYISHL